MCGIVGYIGKKNAVQIALDGLRRLEYRGYDSAGIAAIEAGGSIFIQREVGKISALEKKLKNLPQSSLAIAHTRWATHGEPSVLNAHPHADCTNKIFVAHNGIIENHDKIREALMREGHIFRSETDTEVLSHLIERHLAFGAPDLKTAVLQALRHVVGTFGLVAISLDEPQTLVGARRGSPLLVGIGRKEYIVASDAAAVLNRTRKVIYLNDNEMAVLTPRSKKIFNILRTGAKSSRPLKKDIKIIDWSLEDAEKGEFDHFMEKEIHEIPQVIENALRGRAIVKDGNAKLGGLDSVSDRLKKTRRIIITACGTSYYAGLVGKYLFESLANLPTEVIYGSEFRYHVPILDKETLVLAISQSGETADTLEAVREAKKAEVLTLGVVNVVGSSIAREVHAGIYNHAGPEIAVASTKAFVSQLTVLALAAVYFGRIQGSLDVSLSQEILKELVAIPSKAKKILASCSEILALAKSYSKYDNFMYLGRKYSWPVSLEGALKLKEISYIHAEGYPAGEMKHGPIALADAHFPAIIIIPQDSVYEKTLSNLQELKTRKTKIIALTTEGNDEIGKYANHILTIPQTREELSPILSIIPLQIFAYYMAVFKGRDVDKPRNLAKSVTVE
ncbi:MAG: glutamine--fructose-6-phosphate transaminase (isomerizing) [Candidatus Niyogibacteria bacterium]|nr:MAG: glutamine--fructose-6-phosphate transaminase (isomerizing) [Candidatus Niyogibacteria bacterium]